MIDYVEMFMKNNLECSVSHVPTTLPTETHKFFPFPTTP